MPSPHLKVGIVSGWLPLVWGTFSQGALQTSLHCIQSLAKSDPKPKQNEPYRWEASIGYAHHKCGKSAAIGGIP